MRPALSDEKRGRISDGGIKEDLGNQLKSLPEGDNSLRIALVHHHPILIPDLVEPDRGYDAIVDGGDLLKVLRQHGFHLILHGHKHLPFNFSEDSRAAYSTRQPREQRPILVVCGGSAGSSGVSEQMQTPTNYYNILRIKWLPMSGECRSRIEPRQLVRFESGTLLPRGEWHWEPSLPDDRCYEPSPAEPDETPLRGQTIPFADGGVDDTPRISAYQTGRGAFPVVEIRPSLEPSQAHEAHVWIEHHIFTKEVPDPPLVKVVWSAGKLHEVTSVSDDPSGRFDAVFTYYGPMLVMAELMFADGHQSTRFIYVQMRRRFQAEGA
jgi:3',5'-cyclic AMP phosphodiesterase CpdA